MPKHLLSYRWIMIGTVSLVLLVSLIFLSNLVFRSQIDALGSASIQLFAFRLLLGQLRYLIMFGCVYAAFGSRGVVTLALFSFVVDALLLGGGPVISPSFAVELLACVSAGVTGCVAVNGIKAAAGLTQARRASP